MKEGSINYKTEAERQAYHNGFISGAKYGISLYAWWKDGVEYVGCGILTLKDALDKFMRQWDEDNEATILKPKLSDKARKQIRKAVKARSIPGAKL